MESLSGIDDVLGYFARFSQPAPDSIGNFITVDHGKSEPLALPPPLRGAESKAASGSFTGNGSGYFSTYCKHVRRVSVECIPRQNNIPDVSPEQYMFLNWEYISGLDLTSTQLAKYADWLVWDAVSRHISLHDALKFSNRVNWEVVLAHTQVPYKILRTLNVPWRTVLCTQLLTDEQLETRFVPLFEGNADGWKLLSRWQRPSEGFIDKYADKLDWEIMCCIHKLSFELALRHVDKIYLADLEWFGGYSNEQYVELVQAKCANIHPSCSRRSEELVFAMD